MKGYTLPLDAVDAAFFENASDDEKEAIYSLIKSMGPGVYVTTKPFSLFHWAPLTQISLSPKSIDNDPAVSRYVSDKAEKFWSEQDMGSMMGNGLYLAQDPVATIEYGRNGEAFLAVLTVEKGTRVLQPLSSYFKSAALSKIGCDGLGYSGFVTSPRCGKYLKLAMRALRIKLVEYDYQVSYQCEQHPSAYVLVDEKYPNTKNTRVLSSRTNMKDPNSAAFATDLLTISDQQLSDKFPLWRDGTHSPEKDPKAIAAKRDRYLVTCPTYADHLVPLFSFTPEELSRMYIEAKPDLETTKALGLPVTYHGNPVIKIKAVTSPEEPIPGLSGEMSRFCDGTSSCDYDLSFSAERSTIKDTKTIIVEWLCLSKSAPKGVPNKKTFNSKDLSRIAISCSKSK